MRGTRAPIAAVLASILLFAARGASATDRHSSACRCGLNASFLETILAVAYPDGRDRNGRPVDVGAVGREVDRLAERLRPLVADRTDPRRVVSVLNRFLYEDERFVYDPAPGNTDNFLPDRVLARKCGNCLGLSVLSLALAERLGLPLRASYVPTHCFLRYEDGSARINIETAEKGADWADARYARVFGLTGDRPYLRTLGNDEMIGVYLKSLGAASSRAGRDDEALDLYRCAARRAPGLAEIPYNAGVSHQKAGRLDAAVAEYRKALAIDPSLAPARDNLAVAFAGLGRYPEALAEARLAVTLDPGNVSTRGNLAAAFCACGMTEEGTREFERILEADPANERALRGLAKARGLVTP